MTSPRIPYQHLMLATVAVTISITPLICAGAEKQDGAYPVRPVRVIVQFAPGGNVDTAARVIARQVSQQLGQQFVVDNRPGGSGNIGVQMVSKSTPDGYTLGIAHIGNLALNPHTLGDLPYEPIKDFTAIGRIADAPNLLVVHPSIPAKSVTELVNHIKANPGKISYASGGVGTVGHLAGEMLSNSAGLKMMHIPYKGTSPAVAELIAGNTQMSFGGPPSFVVHLKSGRLRAIAITTLKRSPAFADLPTIAESGYPGFEAVAWIGINGPMGIPRSVVTQLNLAIIKAQQSDETKKTLGGLGMELTESNAAEFEKFIRAEYSKWGKLIKDQNIKAN